MTGYLTQRGNAEGRQFKLAIPNLEIRDIFVTQIMEFFKDNVREDGETLNRFCDALQNGDVAGVEEIFSEYLIISSKNSPILLGGWDELQRRTFVLETR